MDKTNALSLRGDGTFRNGPTLTYLIDDEFTDTLAAGSVNGTAATPGPGTRTASIANVTVGDGSIAATGTNIWGESSWYHDNAVSRATGIALVQSIEFVSATSDLMAGWRTDQSLDYLGYTNTGIQASGGVLKARFASTSGSPDLMSLAAGSYLFVTVLRTTGRLIFVRIAGVWELIWVDATDSTATLYSGLVNYTVTRIVKSDFSRVVQLPAPFDSDDGLATDVLSGSVSAGTTFTHEADCLIEFTVTTLPSSGSVEIRFRHNGSSIYWYLLVYANGSLQLYEAVSGVPTSRGFAGTVVSSGHRIVVITDDESIKVYSNDVSRITYSSAANSKTSTAGSVHGLGTGGVVSDLKTWPRELDGIAASILNKASA